MKVVRRTRRIKKNKKNTLLSLPGRALRAISRGLSQIASAFKYPFYTLWYSFSSEQDLRDALRSHALDTNITAVKAIIYVMSKRGRAYVLDSITQTLRDCIEQGDNRALEIVLASCVPYNIGDTSLALSDDPARLQVVRAAMNKLHPSNAPLRMVLKHGFISPNAFYKYLLSSDRSDFSSMLTSITNNLSYAQELKLLTEVVKSTGSTVNNFLLNYRTRELFLLALKNNEPLDPGVAKFIFTKCDWNKIFLPLESQFFNDRFPTAFKDSNEILKQLEKVFSNHSNVYFYHWEAMSALLIKYYSDQKNYVQAFKYIKDINSFYKTCSQLALLGDENFFRVLESFSQQPHSVIETDNERTSAARYFLSAHYIEHDTEKALQYLENDDFTYFYYNFAENHCNYTSVLFKYAVLNNQTALYQKMMHSRTEATLMYFFESVIKNPISGVQPSKKPASLLLTQCAYEFFIKALKNRQPPPSWTCDVLFERQKFELSEDNNEEALYNLFFGAASQNIEQAVQLLKKYIRSGSKYVMVRFLSKWYLPKYNANLLLLKHYSHTKNYNAIVECLTEFITTKHQFMSSRGADALRAVCVPLLSQPEVEPDFLNALRNFSMYIPPQEAHNEYSHYIIETLRYVLSQYYLTHNNIMEAIHFIPVNITDKTASELLKSDVPELLDSIVQRIPTMEIAGLFDSEHLKKPLALELLFMNLDFQSSLGCIHQLFKANRSRDVLVKVLAERATNTALPKNVDRGRIRAGIWLAEYYFGLASQSEDGKLDMAYLAKACEYALNFPTQISDDTVCGSNSLDGLRRIQKMLIQSYLHEWNPEKFPNVHEEVALPAAVEALRGNIDWSVDQSNNEFFISNAHFTIAQLQEAALKPPASAQVSEALKDAADALSLDSGLDLSLDLSLDLDDAVSGVNGFGSNAVPTSTANQSPRRRNSRS